MDVKPVAHRHLVSFGGKGRAWTAWITGETPVFGTPVMTEFAYPQSAIDALTAEVERLSRANSSVRFELDMLEQVRLRDNEYLIDRAEAAEAEAARLRQEIAAMDGEG